MKTIFYKGLFKISLLSLLFVFKSQVFLCGQSLEKFEKNGKFGLKKSGNKQIVIPATLDSIGYTWEDLIAIKKNGKYGYLNKDGSVLMPAKFNGNKKSLSNYGAVKKSNKWGFFDKNNTVSVQFDYEDVIFGYNLIKRKLYIAVKEKGFWGVLDKQKNWLIPPIYEEIKFGSEDILKAKQSGKWGYINYQNEKQSDFTFDEIQDYYTHRNDIFLARIGREWGAVNKIGEVIFPFNYDEIEPFYRHRDDIKLKVKKEQKWGVVNFNNPSNDRIKYDSIVKPKYLDVAVIYSKNKIGLLEYKRKVSREKLEKEVLIEEEYEISADEDEFNDISVSEVDGKSVNTEIKEQAEELVPPIYDELKVATQSISDPIYKETACDVRIGNNWGLISQNGDEIVPISASYVPKHLRAAIDHKNGNGGAIKN